MNPGFDVALALRRIVTGFWLDFAPIVVAGFVMVTLPSVALTLAGIGSGATVIATFGGLLRVLYVVIVVHGALARIDGRPLTPAAFVNAGIAASPRALSTALVIGAGTVIVLVAVLLTAYAGAAAPLLRGLIVAVAFAAAMLVTPAVPLALTVRASPWTALARAAALTRGARGGIAVVLGIVALTVVPARLVLAGTVYELGANAARVAAIDASMTLASPGLWLLALFDLLVWSAGAVVPAAMFAGLRDRR